MVDISSTSLDGWYQQYITGWLISAAHHWMVDISSTSLDGWYQQYITGWLISAAHHWMVDISSTSLDGWYQQHITGWLISAAHHWMVDISSTSLPTFHINLIFDWRRDMETLSASLVLCKGNHQPPMVPSKRLSGGVVISVLLDWTCFWTKWLRYRSFETPYVRVVADTVYIITANYIIQTYIIQDLTISFSVPPQHVIDPVCSGCLSLNDD